MARARVSLTLADFGIDPRTQRARMQAIARMVLAEWQATARLGLRSGGKLLPAYIKALAIREVTDKRAVVDLAGEGVDGKGAMLARMAEWGMGPGGIGTQGPYDIRTFVLKAGTRNLRFGKKGWYVNVPFDHTIGGIEAMGGKEAVSAARKLTHTTATNEGRTRWGGRLAAGFTAVATNTHGPEPVRHVTDRLAGLVRLGSTYSRGPEGAPRVQTSGYRTWRRMSAAGQPWYHPGVPAARLTEKVVARVPDLIRDVLAV